MTQLLINPGCQSKIFEISPEPGKTEFNNSEFINASLESARMIYSHYVDFAEDFTRLRIIANYMATAKETGVTLYVATLSKDFRVERTGRILPEELLIALEHCVELMNTDMEDKKPTSPYLPDKFKLPAFADQTSLLVQIARELNDR